MENRITLPRSTNQARGMAEFAIDFLTTANPDPAVLERLALFHTDAVIAGVAALACRENAPMVLRRDALRYVVQPDGVGATLFGSQLRVHPEKAIGANCAAVREYDTNGTVFGYNPGLGAGHCAGEFGHNDFYPVCIAAAQVMNRDGRFAMLGMLLLDEIRGRLAEVFSLKDCKIDHVLHGAIATAVTYGAMVGASVNEIESAVGMVVAHYVPFRAIRAGKALSDSKGASAALSAEAAIMCVIRAMGGFVGSKDVFRNPEAVFRLFGGPGQHFQRAGSTAVPATESLDESPFDLVLTRAGSKFAIMDMHFKLGLYEHQSAGAIQALLDLLTKHPELLRDNGNHIDEIRILAYQPAFGIIGDLAKRDPRNRQSADHSMVYIVATLLRKAIESGRVGWVENMLMPDDYSEEALHHTRTRALMERITFAHGGPEFDRRYPEGIPTQLVITDDRGAQFDSGLVMFPAGHARNSLAVTPVDLGELLRAKFLALGALATDDPAALIARLSRLPDMDPAQLQAVYNFPIRNLTD